MKSIYDGHGCTADAYRNKLEPVFNAILRQWHKLSEQEGFKYALAFGTYIAWLRHESYIPWDYDLDVYVGRDSLQTLMNLAETRPDWCMSPQDFQVRPRPTDKKASRGSYSIHTTQSRSHNAPNTVALSTAGVFLFRSTVVPSTARLQDWFISMLMGGNWHTLTFSCLIVLPNPWKTSLHHTRHRFCQQSGHVL